MYREVGWRTTPATSHPLAAEVQARRGELTEQGRAPRRQLFRQEAIQFQEHDRQWGQVASLQSPRTRTMVGLIVGSAASIVLFLFVTQYARKETVLGYLAPVGGTARIFAPQQGVIGAVYVEQGQAVQQGDPLLSVTINQVAADGSDVNATILNALARQRDLLTQQIAAEERRIGSEQERLTAEKESLEVGLGFLAAQLSDQRQRIHLSELVVESARQLVPKGLVSELEQKRREDALADQKQRLNALSGEVVTGQSKITEARYKLEQLGTVMADKIQPLRSELSTVEQRIAEIDGRRAYIIRAPISGNVASLQASVGQTADPQHVQLQILPALSTLQAELLIPARAIGFIEPGQDVRILYDAFPYQHYGTYRGHIVNVSQTMLSSADLSAPMPLKEPAYRATVALERPDITANGKKIPLQADMLLKADVILDKRTLIEWIVDPLRSLRLQG